jgi:hypothetical protein
MDVLKISLLTDIYTHTQKLALVYRHIVTQSGKIDLSRSEEQMDGALKIQSVNYIPEYMETVMYQPNKWTKKSHPSVKGYAIKLIGFKDVAAFMLHQHPRKSRKTVNRAMRRLEQCFDIRYRMYERDITKDEYSFLMETLKNMIVSRFRQKQKQSDSLMVWEKVLNTSYELIKEGKASLFVIYNRDKPINISFNYQYNRILFSYISSYDIDYSKFSLGQILIYKHLEWCFKKGFNHFELGWGDFEYKKQWSNYIYKFRHEIVYSKSSFHGFFYALVIGAKTRVIAYLISKGANVYWHRLKKVLGKKQIPRPQSRTYRFSDFSNGISLGAKPISWWDGSFPVNRKIINDFLFTTQEHIDDVSLFYVEEVELFVLKGKKQTKSIQFQNPV